MYAGTKLEYDQKNLDSSIMNNSLNFFDSGNAKKPELNTLASLCDKIEIYWAFGKKNSTCQNIDSFCTELFSSSLFLLPHVYHQQIKIQSVPRAIYIQN